jgi:precorrin-2/cobalt-factor-2 C20-methyltransferase
MDNKGTLFGIGIGPGDSDLITVKGAKLLAACRHVVVPKASEASESVALRIIQPHLSPQAQVHELVFPMTVKQDELMLKWKESACTVQALLSKGEDVCFPTLGDTFLYSTYIYLVQALQAIDPEARIETVPGVTAFSAVAAMTRFPVGVGKHPVTIIPSADDFATLDAALQTNGTVVIMKVGKRLDAIIDRLEERKLLEKSVFAAHVGMADEHIETDLRKLRGLGDKTGYLSIILVDASRDEVK